LKEPLKVFISSTDQDLRAERDAVIKAISRKKDEIEVVAMEYWGSSDKTSKDASLKKLEESDIYIGIIGFFYCSTVDPESGKSITQLEYEYAKALSKPRYVFLKHDDTLVKPSFVEQDPKNIPKLKAFKELIKNDRLYSTFRTPDELALEVVLALDKGLKEQGRYLESPVPIVGFGLFQDLYLPNRHLRTDLPQVVTLFTTPSNVPAKTKIKLTVFLGCKKLGVVEDEKGYYSGRTVHNVNPPHYHGNFVVPRECVDSTEALIIQVDKTLVDKDGKEFPQFPVCYAYVRRSEKDPGNYWFLEPTSHEDLMKAKGMRRA